MTERTIALGIMKLNIAGKENDGALDTITEAATVKFNRVVQQKLDIQVESFPFVGPSLTSNENGYRALDFVQIGINEKTERKLAFLLIITDVEIAAASMSYLLALPSQLTNVAVISTRRLLAYGEDKFPQEEIRTERLTTLMLHCFGRLLNLKYTAEPTNYLARVQVPDDLDTMRHFTEVQHLQMIDNLPREANDRYSEGSKLAFVIP